MNKSRGFQRGWWLVLITLAVMYTASVPFIFIQPPEDSFLYMLSGEAVLIIPVIIGLFMLFWEDMPGGILKGIGVKRFSPKLLPFLLLLPAAAQNFVGTIFMPLQSILTVLFGAQQYDDVVASRGVAAFIQNFIVMCILAPVFEETLCRGILMRLFHRYGLMVQLFFSAFGFALLHQSAQSFLPIFFLGVLLGVIRITTGSLFAAMIAHSASNLYSLLLLMAGMINPVIEWLILVVGVIGFPVLVWFFIKTCENTSNWHPDVPKTTAPVGLSAAMIISIGIFMGLNLMILLSRILTGSLIYELSNMMMY